MGVPASSCQEGPKGRAGGAPYIAGESAKHWYLGGRDGYGQLNKFYIILLLTASQHKQPVPHLARPAEYRKMLDTCWHPPLKRRKLIIGECDAWGMWT